MITNDELDLIELTLEQGVDDVDQLVNRAISLHAHCAALVAEVRRQRSLLGMGVRIVPMGIVSTSTGTNEDAPRVPVAAAGGDASVDRPATVDEIRQALVLSLPVTMGPYALDRTAQTMHALFEWARS